MDVCDVQAGVLSQAHQVQTGQAVSLGFSEHDPPTRLEFARQREFELKPERVSATILDKVSVLVTVDKKEMILSIRDFLVLYDIRREK